MAEYVVDFYSEHDGVRCEEVVRCRECGYYDEIIHACDHPCVTPLRGDCPENWIFSCFDSGFCSYGKRRADG